MIEGSISSETDAFDSDATSVNNTVHVMSTGVVFGGSGGNGNDSMVGGGGFDTLLGHTGNDTLTGNFNADRFVFTDAGGGFGNDVTSEFDATNDAEKIDLSGVAAVVDFADLAANHMTQVGANVVIDDLAGNTITLLNVDITDLDAVDFVF